jgi:hypothetical protein
MDRALLMFLLLALLLLVPQLLLLQGVLLTETKMVAEAEMLLVEVLLPQMMGMLSGKLFWLGMPLLALQLPPLQRQL